ncbi:hypothetical protein MBLNU230_g4902t1 [Neophaeotheca triangularis]
MEKYSQFRDKGTGIAPFLPVSAEPTSKVLLPFHVFLYVVRMWVWAFAWFIWFAIVQWTPVNGTLRKANFWCLLGIPGIWWVDMKVDGVRRGSLSQYSKRVMPNYGSVLAASYTSPIDILYLACIYDPIFTQSYPNTRKVRHLSFATALLSAFSLPPTTPPPNHELTDIAAILQANPSRFIATFPETTTSNGRAILRLSPSLLSAPTETKIYPVSIRYTTQDIVTPLPGWREALKFSWRLNSKPTTCLRVRVGIPLSSADRAPNMLSALNDGTGLRKQSPQVKARQRSSYESNFFDTLDSGSAASSSAGEGEDGDGEGALEGKGTVVDLVAEALARLGRVRRVDLGVKEKEGFVGIWLGKGRSARKGR